VQQVHATAVSIDGDGVLITGPSGAGKSDLALRLIDDGAALVADDRCDLSLEGDSLRVSAPAALAGMLEVRGVGIVVMAHETSAPLAMVCDLVPPADVERLPEAERSEEYGVSLPLYRLDPFEASAPAKVRAALGLVTGRIASAT